MKRTKCAMIYTPEIVF